jgi:hypothetical protein
MLWWTGVACAEIYLRHQDFSIRTLMPVFISLSVMSMVISIPVVKGYFFQHKTLAQINAAYPISTYLHYYLDVIVFLALGLFWWKRNLKGFDPVFSWFRFLAPISFALYIVHFPFIWLNMPFIQNFYLLYLVKLILILLSAYLLEIKMQPLANKLFKNKIRHNRAELENQAF